MELEFSHSNANIMALVMMASFWPTNVTRTVEHWVVIEPIDIDLIDSGILLFHAFLRIALIADTF